MLAIPSIEVLCYTSTSNAMPFFHNPPLPQTYMVVARVMREYLVVRTVLGVSHVGPMKLVFMVSHIVQDTLPTVVCYQNL